MNSLCTRRNSFNSNSLFKSIFDDNIFSLFQPISTAPSWTPAVDIVEKEDKFLLTVDVPGVDKKDIKVEVVEGILTISGERKLEERKRDEDYYRFERFQGGFSRSFDFGDIKDDEIKADYKNGTLSLEIPKQKEEKKRRSIEIV